MIVCELLKKRKEEDTCTYMYMYTCTLHCTPTCTHEHCTCTSTTTLPFTQDYFSNFSEFFRCLKTISQILFKRSTAFENHIHRDVTGAVRIFISQRRFVLRTSLLVAINQQHIVRYFSLNFVHIACRRLGDPRHSYVTLTSSSWGRLVSRSFGSVRGQGYWTHKIMSVCAWNSFIVSQFEAISQLSQTAWNFQQLRNWIYRTWS